MALGMLLSWIIPSQLIGLFTTNPETIKIGVTALHIISFGFMIMYQIRNKVKVNNYVKMIILIAFIIGVILVFVSSSRLDLKSFGF